MLPVVANSFAPVSAKGHQTHTHTQGHIHEQVHAVADWGMGVGGEGNRHTIMADGKINLKSSRNQRRQLVIEVGVVLVASEKDRKRVSVQ